MKLNLNATVRVTLTPYGVTKYKEYWDNYQRGRVNPVYPDLKDNILETELHHFMFVLGNYVHPALDPVCLTEIEILH